MSTLSGGPTTVTRNLVFSYDISIKANNQIQISEDKIIILFAC